MAIATLKGALLPDDDGTTTTTNETATPCPMCSCVPLVIIDDSFENTKAECVYDKLVSSILMKNLLTEFVGSDEYHVTYKVVPSLVSIYSSDQAYGKCVDNGDGTTTILINSYFFDKVAPVTIAKTILHETIHANIYQKVSSVGGLDNLSPDNFERLFAYNQTYGDYDYQHDYMSQYYIPKMASTLQQFDGNSYSYSYYEALSWMGLYYTYGWQNMTQAQKDAIYNKVSIINSGNKNCN